MLNPATQPQDQLNEFTELVQVIHLRGWGHCKVRLRDGTMVCPYFKAAEHETENDVFFGNLGERMYCWNLDGTSVTRSAYDMMEIVDASET